MITKWIRSLPSWPLALVLGCASNNGTGPKSVDYPAPEPLRGAEAARLITGDELSRPTFVRDVLARNTSVESARHAWRASAAHARQSGAFEDPMVTLEAAPLSIVGAARFGATASISQKLPWPGKLSLDESIARAETDAMKSDYETTRRDLALGAALLYDNYFVVVRSLEVNVHHVALLRELKEAALAQLEVGRGSTLDPLQAEAELAHMEHDAVILTAEREITVAQMNELLHRSPELPLPPPVKDLVATRPLDRTSSNELTESATKNRPEIAAARLRARAEEQRGARASRESLPDFTVSTSYNSMWDMPEHRWMVGIGANIPVQFERRRAAVDEADASRARMLDEADRLTDKARTEVVVAQKRLEEAEHVLRIHDGKLQPIARDQVDAARAGFAVGRNDFSAVIMAEKNLRTVELDLQVARADYDRRRAELDHAVGKIAGLEDTTLHTQPARSAP